VIGVDGSGLSRHRIRSGLLFLAGLLAQDRKPEISRATPAAVIELATFATMAFTGTEDGQPPTSRSVDWAAATLVLAGDFRAGTAPHHPGTSRYPRGSGAYAGSAR
jgi:hypothetical protein